VRVMVQPGDRVRPSVLRSWIGMGDECQLESKCCALAGRWMACLYTQGWNLYQLAPQRQACFPCSFPLPSLINGFNAPLNSHRTCTPRVLSERVMEYTLLPAELRRLYYLDFS